MEGASTALVLTWTADSAGTILCGNPLHRPVTMWAKASALSRSHQGAQADPSLLQLPGIDTHGYELPEIPCCHLVFPTADHQPNKLRIFQLSFRSEGLQRHHWRLGQPTETRHLPAYVTAVRLSQLSQAGARWTLIDLCKTHPAFPNIYWGKHLLLTPHCLSSMLCSGGPWPWNRFQEDPKASPPPAWSFPGPSSAPGPRQSMVSTGKALEQKAGTKEKELQTTATWSSDGALHLQTASWESGSFSRTGKPARGVSGTVSYRFVFRDQLPC